MPTICACAATAMPAGAVGARGPEARRVQARSATRADGKSAATASLRPLRAARARTADGRRSTTVSCTTPSTFSTMSASRRRTARRALGIWVVLFLLVFTWLAWLVKQRILERRALISTLAGGARGAHGGGRGSGNLSSRRSIMTLFSAPSGPWSHRTRIVLAEKGISIEIVSVEAGALSRGSARPQSVSQRADAGRPRARAV